MRALAVVVAGERGRKASWRGLRGIGDVDREEAAAVAASASPLNGCDHEVRYAVFLCTATSAICSGATDRSSARSAQPRDELDVALRRREVASRLPVIRRDREQARRPGWACRHASDRPAARLPDRLAAAGVAANRSGQGRCSQRAARRNLGDTPSSI